MYGFVQLERSLRALSLGAGASCAGFVGFLTATLAALLLWEFDDGHCGQRVFGIGAVRGELSARAEGHSGSLCNRG